MTAVFINEKLLGFIPDETPIYANSYSKDAKKQNDSNHAIIKEWLLDKCSRIIKDASVTYLPDKNSEYNGCLIVNNKTLFRVTTEYHLNLYQEANHLLWRTLD